jgi:hypothetical protein
MNTNKIMIITMLLITIFIPVKLYSFSIISSTVTPNTAKSISSQYSLAFNATSAFLLNFDIKIAFPTNFNLGSVTACVFKNSGVISSTAVCALNSVTN